MPGVAFKAGEWHHIVLNFRHLDTGRPDAQTEFFVDDRRIGELRDRDIRMDWDLDKAGIYVGVNFIGLLDEFAVFQRSLTADEIRLLHQRPDVLAGLAN